MFCPDCGEQLPDDVQYCEKCNVNIDSKESIIDTPNRTLPPEKTNQKKSRSRYILGAVICAVVIAVVLTIFLTTRPLKINLNHYIEIDYSGYNTQGIVEYHFNEDAFLQDYAGRIKYTGNTNLVNLFQLDETAICKALINDCIKFRPDKSNGVSNGDILTINWDCNDARAKNYYDVKLSYKEQQFTVEGLEELQTVDPFENVEMLYSGIAPYAQAHCNLKNDAPYAQHFSFDVTPNDNLKNGDTVTVVLEGATDKNWLATLAAKYGITLSQTEKTFKVEGLGTYVSKLSEINEETFSQMTDQAESVINAYVAKNWTADSHSSAIWSNHDTLESLQYLGSYLLTSKSSKASDATNKLYLVYEIKASLANPEDDQTQSITYYYTIRYDNLTISADGAVTLDLSKYQTNNPAFKRTLGKHWHNFHGYETLDDAFRNCVTSQVDLYNFESNIVTESG